MKEKFSAFYRYSTEEELNKVWNDEKTLFVFDTNILLSIYSYNTQARDTFFSILESLNGRVWLPFHVVLEYQRNRIKSIKQSSSNLENLKRRISDLDIRLNHDEGKIDSIENDFHKVFEQHKNIKNDLDEYIVIYKDLLKKTKIELSKITEELFAKFNNADIEIISVDGSDPIRNKFDEIFSSDKVGDCLFKNGDEIKKFNDDANLRFENKIPPGFKDEKIKGDLTFIYGGIEYYNKFGDLIIFKELIEKAKSNNDKIYNLIFVTDDSKDDWIEATQVNDNKVKIGVLSHLKEEFLRESGIKDFKIIDQESFAEYSSKYISSSIFSSVENLLTNIKQVNSEKEIFPHEELNVFETPDTLKDMDFINDHLRSERLKSLKNTKSVSDIKNEIENFNNSIGKAINSHNLKDIDIFTYNNSLSMKTLSTITNQIHTREDLESAAIKIIEFSSFHSYFESKRILEKNKELILIIKKYQNVSAKIDNLLKEDGEQNIINESELNHVKKDISLSHLRYLKACLNDDMFNLVFLIIGLLERKLNLN